MTIIKEILKAEDAARTIVEQAKENAEKLVAAGRKDQIDALKKLEDELADLQKMKLQDQKKDLADQYQKILRKGHDSINLIESEAASKRREAIKVVIDNVVS
jgi:vacuolar-type H+-ATPase subunit H